MRLTENFSLEELTQSETAERNGIDNTPNGEIIANLQVLASELERVRTLLNGPLIITSGYRCAALNDAINGSSTSQHMKGLAADFICPRAGTPVEICRRLEASGIEFDQLIYEFTWCHIGFGWKTGTTLRSQVMTWNPNTRQYLNGIVG